MHEDGNFVRRIGCQPVTSFPNGIDISDAGDILVGDSHGNQFHVAVYDRRGELISQFQCPQVRHNCVYLLICAFSCFANRFCYAGTSSRWTRRLWLNFLTF